jgi:mono/diheme cytochrome c family protein
MRRSVLIVTVLAAFWVLGGVAPRLLGSPIDEIPPNYIPSGEAMYKQYCAACHGPGGKGGGPATFMLKTPPSDLTRLTARNMGKFPREYVETILRFGPGTPAHGSSDMPTWGTIFQMIDKNNESAVRQRIKNITDFIASLQEQEK